MQTEKSQPDGKRIIPETRWTSFSGIIRWPEKSQPEGKRIMPQTRFTEFPALFVDPRVGIFRSALETNDWLFFLSMKFKVMIGQKPFSFIFDILRRITTFSERHSVFSVVMQKCRHFWKLKFWLYF